MYAIGYLTEIQDVLDINRTIKIMFRTKIMTIPTFVNSEWSFHRDYKSSDSFSQLSSFHIHLLLVNISGIGITASKNEIWKVQQKHDNHCKLLLKYG
jgi:hypothetical protein